MAKKTFRILLKVMVLFFVCTILWVLTYKWFPVPATPLMYLRKSESGEGYVRKHTWVPIKNISRELQLAVICSEDQTFMSHRGFDTMAIQKAIREHESGKRLRGASTISQQTAKNIFLWPGRNWIRKGLEVYFTFLIETLWSKERILEVYLNSIEMGEGIYGAEAAAQFWFHKNAIDLTKKEAATIAAILPNPRSHLANPPSNYIQKRTLWIMEQMSNYGKLRLSK